MQDLYKKIIMAVGEFANNVVLQLPQFISAVLLIIIGYFVAWFLGLLSKKFIYKLDSVFQRASSTSDSHHIKIREVYSFIISKTVFWCILIYFLDSAADALQWRLFINLFNSLINIIPNILAALAIILVGFLLSNYTKYILDRSVSSFFAKVAQWGIIVIIILLGVQQLGINVNLISQLIVIATAALLGSATLAIGFGAKAVTANIIGAQYVKKHFTIGDTVIVSGMQGKLLEITQTNVVVENDNGVNIIPGKVFQEENCVIVKKNVSGNS